MIVTGSNPRLFRVNVSAVESKAPLTQGVLVEDVIVGDGTNYYSDPAFNAFILDATVSPVATQEQYSLLELRVELY